VVGAASATTAATPAGATAAEAATTVMLRALASLGVSYNGDTLM